MTDARVTQVAVEEWAQGTPNAQVTQVAIEEWGSSPIELRGNIGGYDQYGKLNYGRAAYSWSAIQPTLGGALTPVLGLFGGIVPAVSFSASLSIAAPLALSGNFAPTVSFAANLTQTAAFAGNLAPAVTFSAALSVTLPLGLSGNFAPVVSFAGDLTLASLALSGGLAPQTALGGSLTAILPFGGDMTSDVVLAASGLLSGPLWSDSGLCPPPMWAENEPCLDPGWVVTPVLPDSVYEGSVYGLGDYGARLYSQGRWVSTPWAPVELCHG